MKHLYTTISLSLATLLLLGASGEVMAKKTDPRKAHVRHAKHGHKKSDDVKHSAHKPKAKHHSSPKVLDHDDDHNKGDDSHNKDDGSHDGHNKDDGSHDTAKVGDHDHVGDETVGTDQTGGTDTLDSDNVTKTINNYSKGPKTADDLDPNAEKISSNTRTTSSEASGSGTTSSENPGNVGNTNSPSKPVNLSGNLGQTHDIKNADGTTFVTSNS